MKAKVVPGLIGEGAGCNIPDYHGPKHKGHARCIRERRKQQARANLAKTKEKRNRQGVDPTRLARRGSGSLVQSAQDQTPVQRQEQGETLLREIFERPVEDTLAVSDQQRRDR
jgi:hypothetical protein